MDRPRPCAYYPRGREINMRMLSHEERLKYEAARELGLLQKLERVGWAGLSTAESGRIGGMVGAIKRRQRKDQGCTPLLPRSTTP